ncbi:sugar transferase [Akkermansia sp.]|uniref:sugar transferase n=1 Tax=Akkermansia sp. TaxID=1872421 RepID=UPI0025BB72F3|nr:sugar transferase [Akkermansia sp.]
MYKFFGKRVLDIAISLWTLIIVSPLLAVISIILLVNTRKSPFFFQTRVGYRGKLFRVFKFKTLTDARDPEGLLLPDDLRSFPLGTFLRRYSLDELPQLVNIIKGDMSIVGPRPWIPDQLDVFPGRCRMARCSVRPGLTGMAQVYGRNGIPFYRRLCYDIVYARNVSLFMDARIVFQTVVRLLAHKDVRQCEDAFRNISGSMLIRNDLSVPVPFPSKQEES